MKPSHIPELEWKARCELASLYRLIAYYRMTDLIDTHITLRVPGTQDHFLINRYGIPFEKMTASDLILIDINGNKVRCQNDQRRVNVAGFVIHSAIHKSREDLHCVIHTHTAAGMAVACQKNGLLPLTQHALKFYNHLAYHDYEGIALSLDEQERLIQDLGSHKAMILRNHGLLVGGEDVAEAFHEIYFLERACQAQIQAMSANVELTIPDEKICIHTASQFQNDKEDKIIELEWKAALSLIEEQQNEWCR